MSPHRALLLAARGLIDSGRGKFICFALERVWCTGAESKVVDDLIEIIHEGLLPTTDPCTCLEYWCSVVHDHDLTDQHAQLARLAWLDKLLETYHE